VAELGDCWWDTHRQEDGLHWIDAALEIAADAPVRMRATALLYRARLSDVRHYQQYRVDLQASLARFRACDDPAGIPTLARALVESAEVAANYDDASRRTSIAVTHLDRIGDLFELARACTLTGTRRSPTATTGRHWTG
jgi:hypothetical protein